MVEAPEAALAGRAGGADWLVPKKSRPSRESPGRFCLGGAAGAFCCCGGGLEEIEGPAVLARAGVGSSPNKSMTGATALGACWGAAGPLLIEAFLREAERSSFAFSWTTRRGCVLVSGFVPAKAWSVFTTSSSPPSLPRVEGSGMGPSMVHLFASYLVRMKFSILLLAIK
jgi:hypothetical protein